MIKTICRKIGFHAVVAAALIGGFFVCPAQAQFYGQATFAGTSGGTANAQIVTLANVQSMADLRGVTISWVVGTGLTDTGATTVSVNSLTAVAVERMADGTLAALAGGEMPATKMVQATYDGTEFILLTNYAAGVAPGQVAYFDLSSCPAGWSAANGSGGTVNVVGQFIRSLNTGGSGFDPSRTLASAQSDSVRQPGFSGTVTIPSMVVGGIGVTFGAPNAGGIGLLNEGSGVSTVTTPSTSGVSVTGSITNTGPGGSGNGVETRPQNVALLACQAN